VLPPFMSPAPLPPSSLVPSSRRFDVCNSGADNDRVARARAPLSSVQPPVWPPSSHPLSLSLSLSLSVSRFIFSRGARHVGTYVTERRREQVPPYSGSLPP